MGHSHSHGPNCNHDHGHGHSHGHGHGHGHGKQDVALEVEAEEFFAAGEGHDHSHGGGHHDHSKCGGHGHSHGGHGGHSHGGHGGHSHGGHGGHSHGGHDGHSHGGHGGHSHGGHGGHGSHGQDGQAQLDPAHIREMKKRSYYRGLQIKSFVWALTIHCWVGTYFWFCESIENEFERSVARAFMTFIAGMCAYSYYLCTTTKSSNPTSAVPVYVAAHNSATCKTCGFWKPERTHHCKVCGECVLRMDHHCPWIDNCVGYRNHKAFVLFGLYLGTGAMYYGYRGIYYLLHVIDTNEFYDFGTLWLIYWFVISFLICSIGIMVFGLSMFHVNLANNNLTTLESMGGSNMRYPCDTQAKTDKKIVNKYDKGMLGNLYEFFGKTSIWWWFPTIPETINENQNPVYVDQPGPMDVLDFVRGKTNEETPEERVMKPRSLAEIDLEKIFVIAEEFTKDKHLQFFDRMLEIGKRNDNTYKKPEEEEVKSAKLKNENPVDGEQEKEQAKDIKEDTVVVSENEVQV